MNINVVKFFEQYDSDPELRAKVQQAEDCYPGSLEIREALVEATIIPIAAEMGLDFTVDDVRKYETHLKFTRATKDEPIEEGTPIGEGHYYWLLDRGWSNDEAKFCGDNNK